ncbi:hypothetical protein AAFC00_007254 [Neodothiora populina]|uniref:Ankyrin repeat protein n=1 Tax=Neodothiora populina TaxID=2781224 RepID=A0ABR3PHW3_9PEZI
MATITIDRLLNLVPDQPQTVLTHIQQTPSLASAQDSHGYSLLHASVSYNQALLLRALVRDFDADINLRDEDDETPLFAAENVDIARVVLEELNGDASARNSEGQTAAEKMSEENEAPVVAAYIRDFVAGAAVGGAVSGASVTQVGVHVNGGASGNGIAPPPPLPQGVNIEMGTMTEGDQNAVGEPDPEIRRRIEELAARPDFESEETQAELRRLVTDALGGYSAQAADSGRETKRRAE